MEAVDFKVKLTGTNAILRHIARKHNLCGRTEEEMVRVDMAAEQVMDMRWEQGLETDMDMDTEIGQV